MSEIKRFFVERKADFREENTALLQSLVRDLGLSTLEDVRIIRRYDLDLDESFDTKRSAISYSQSHASTRAMQRRCQQSMTARRSSLSSRCLVSTISAPTAARSASRL